MVRALSAACLFAFGLGSVQASAAVIFSSNFNGYTGTMIGAQPGTLRPAYTNGTIPGWVNSTGNGSVNAVDRGNGDFAIQFYDRNVIFYGTSLAANDLGKTYRVSFESSIAASTNAAQVTGPDSFAVIDVRGAEGSIGSTVFKPSLTSTAFAPNSFTYVGTGSGGVFINILDGGADDGRYGAAVDNVSISSVPESSTWAMMILGTGAIGGAMRRRSKPGSKASLA